jgi:hypothetical protein
MAKNKIHKFKDQYKVEGYHPRHDSAFALTTHTPRVASRVRDDEEDRHYLRTEDGALIRKLKRHHLHKKTVNRRVGLKARRGRGRM